MAQTLSQIRELLDARGLAPRHKLGQNFLIDANLVRKLLDASGVSAGDLVLEVGPGTGTLTGELLERGAVVVACELDPAMAALLRDTLVAQWGGGPSPKLMLIKGDCLESKHEISREIVNALDGRPFRLVANLPYGAATPLMMALLARKDCLGQYVTIQREVADRLLAGPGSKDYGPLGVVAQAVANVRLIAKLPPECFWPRPDVSSAMVEIVPRERPRTENAARLAAAAQKLFGQRRKQIGAIVGRGFAWPEGVRPEARAEELSVEQIEAIAERQGLPDH